SLPRGAYFLLHLCVSVFLYSSGVPRYLHSFPTRRSSDLAARSEARHHPGFRRNDASAARRGAARVARDDPHRLDRTRAQGAADRDRKSTRLNSSHVKISYAVFCLKKKNNSACRVTGHMTA